MKLIKNQATGKAQKTQKLLTGIVIALVIILGAALWLSVRFLSGQSEQVAIFKAGADAPATQYEDLLKTKNQLEKLGDISKLLQQALPDGNNQSLIIAEINRTAQDNKVPINKLNFLGNTTNSVAESKKSSNKVIGADVEPISIEIGAMNYSQLIGFLKQIEQNRWIMQPTSISIQPDEDDSSKIASLDLSLNLYVKKGTGQHWDLR